MSLHFKFVVPAFRRNYELKSVNCFQAKWRMPILRKHFALFLMNELIRVYLRPLVLSKVSDDKWRMPKILCIFFWGNELIRVPIFWGSNAEGTDRILPVSGFYLLSNDFCHSDQLYYGMKTVYLTNSDFCPICRLPIADENMRIWGTCLIFWKMIC